MVTFGLLAQLVEQLTFNQLVAGSNPAQPILRPVRLVRSRTPGFHPGNTGSNPVRVVLKPS